MKIQFPELIPQREEVRMMYRASHLYILFCALLNVMTACYFKTRTYANRIDLIASSLLLLAPCFFVLGFFVESPIYALTRPLSFLGVVLITFAVVLITVTTYLKTSKIKQCEN